MGQGSIIGYEINEKTCQISFYNDKEMEPQTLEVDADNFQIPLIIGKLRDTWAYGKEAKRLATLKEGFTVARLLSRSLANEKLNLEMRHMMQYGCFLSLFRCLYRHFPKLMELCLAYRFLQKNWHRCFEGSQFA